VTTGHCSAKATEFPTGVSIHYLHKHYHFVGEHNYDYQVTLGLNYHTYKHKLWTLFKSFCFWQG